MGSQPGVHGASPLVAREEGRISHPQAEVMTDRRGGGDEQRLSPHRPDVTAGSGRGAGRLEIADHGGDERPRSHSRLEKTLRDEALVGSGDRHPGNAELLGETAGRREAVARAEAPAQDGVDDAAVDPADPVARRGGGDVSVHPASLIGMPKWGRIGPSDGPIVARSVAAMTEQRRTLIGVLAWEGFLTSELVAPVEVLGAAIERGLLDAEVKVVAPKAGPLRSAEGLRVLPDVTIEDCPELDVLVLSASAEMDGALSSPDIVDFVARRGKGARYLASNCSAAFLVGKAGLLEGRRVTTYRGGEEELQVQFPEAEVSADDVVVDGGLISSSGEVVSYQAALALLAELSVSSSDRVAADLYIRWLSLPSRRGRLPGRPALPDRRWRRGGGGPPPCGR